MPNYNIKCGHGSRRIAHKIYKLSETDKTSTVALDIIADTINELQQLSDQA